MFVPKPYDPFNVGSLLQRMVASADAARKVSLIGSAEAS